MTKANLGNYDLGELTTTEIYNESDTDSFDEYRFRLLDTEGNVILSSSKHYLSQTAAFEALQNAVSYYLNFAQSIQVKQSANGKWYFNVVNEVRKILARRIEYFDTEQECIAETMRVREILENN